MAFDFPSSPSVGTIYSPAGGPTWQWNGTTWLSTAPSGLVPEAPTDGQNYVRRNGVWVLAPGTAEAKNRIVNPAMQISQELGFTATATPLAYIVDQWLAQVNGVPFTAQKTNATAHQISLVATTGTALTTTGFFGFAQPIEGTRLWDFGYGAAGALPSVLRFDAYCSVAGTYGISLRNGGVNRSYVAPLTVSTPNVWATYSLTIPGDTTGTWVLDNTAAMTVAIVFASGTNLQTAPNVWTAGNFLAPPGITNGAATTNNIFYLRNVGLYLDPQNTGIAPPWQMPDEAQELAACQRYWRGSPQMTGKYYSATQVSLYGSFAPPMRTDPAVTLAITTNAISEIGVATRTITGVIGLAGQAIGDIQCGVNATGTSPNMAATAVQKVFVINARM